MTELINSALSPKTYFAGFAVCHVCQLRGRDADECRANPRNDRKAALCICGAHVSANIPDDLRHGQNNIFAQPREIKDLVAALTESQDPEEELMHLTGLGSGEGTGAVAQGFGPDDIGTTIILSRGERPYDCSFERLEVSFTGNDLKSAAKADPNIGAGYDEASFASRVPDGVNRTAKRLAAAGYRLVHTDFSGSMCRLGFVKGICIQGAGRSSLVGVQANLTWIV